MGRRIEGAIHEIENELHHQRCDCGTAQLSTGLHDAMKTAVNAMRKYQKIEDIYYHQSGQALEDSLRSVIEDGKID